MKSAWKNTEEEFEGIFTANGKDAFVFRLSDTAAAKATGGKGAFVKAQPSDFIVTNKGHTFYAEVKSARDEISFPHSNIRPFQMASSRRIVKAGGDFVFFLKNLLTNQWYCVPAQVIHAAEKKSTRWADIEQYKWVQN